MLRKPLKAGRATAKDQELVRRCPQCVGLIVRGEAVVVLEQSQFVPFNVRRLVFHEDCVREVFSKKSASSKNVKAVKEEIAEVYYTTRTREQTMAWLAETAPDSDLMRWTPADSFSE